MKTKTTNAGCDVCGVNDRAEGKTTCEPCESKEKLAGHTAIPGYPSYAACKDGTIFSVGSNWRGYGQRKLVPAENGKGYLKVRVYVGGNRKSIAVHRLIAATFLPERPSEKHEIRHINGDPYDNRAENLAWGTRKDNASDRALHGRTSKGKTHSESIKHGHATPVSSPPRRSF